MSRGTAVTVFVVFLVCVLAFVGMDVTFHMVAAATTYELYWSWDLKSNPHPYEILLGRMGWGALGLGILGLAPLALLGWAVTRVRLARLRGRSLGVRGRRAAKRARRAAGGLERLGVLALLTAIVATGSAVFSESRELLLIDGNRTLVDFEPVFDPIGTLLPAAAFLYVLGLAAALLLRRLTPGAPASAGDAR